MRSVWYVDSTIEMMLDDVIKSYADFDACNLAIQKCLQHITNITSKTDIKLLLLLESKVTNESDFRIRVCVKGYYETGMMFYVRAIWYNGKVLEGLDIPISNVFNCGHAYILGLIQTRDIMSVINDNLIKTNGLTNKGDVVNSMSVSSKLYSSANELFRKCVELVSE